MEHQVISQGSSNEEDTSTGGSGAGTECVLDYTNEFTTDEIFKSRDALVEWTRDRGNSNGLVIIIKNSDAGGAGNKKPRIKFCCEKGGVYKRKIDENVHKKRRLRSSGTKKCGCPFLLRGVSLGDNDEWKLEVVCGVHNHDAAKSNARRLSEEEKALLVDMSKSLAKPKDILRTIKQKEGLNETTMKTIYNVRQRLKLKENVVRSQMHVLLSKLSDHNYIEWHRSSDDSNIVKDLFWTHPVSVDILRAFPQVLIMDCTCKTYSFPLLEIVGVTCTNITFSAAFAYLDAKNEDNYIWALSRLRTMLDEHCLPTVIVTDNDLPLMTAIHSIFPSAQHFLCRLHISKNVLAKCKGMFEGKDQLEKFIMSWNMLVLSETEHEYLKRLAELDYYFGRYPHALEYVKNTWLNEYKERFVSVWTDTCMHFGHTTSNRVEGASAKLKQLLGNSRGSFETSWEKIHSLLELQHLDIKVSLEKCLTIIQRNFMHDELKELRGFVSTVALNIIVCESKKGNSVGLDSSSCSCTIRHTHGLPCVHEIAKYRQTSRPIPLYCVDAHWRKLDLLYSPKNSDHATDIITQMYTILHQWMDSNEDTRRHISLKLEEIMNMESMPLTKPKEQPSRIGTTTRCNLSAFELALSCRVSHSPVDTVATTSHSEKPKRRPPKMKVHRMCPLTSSELKEQFPTALRPYISSIRDFAGDGNCGYRVVAGLMGFGDDAWSKVRRDLLNELCSHETQYENLFGRRDRVDELMHTLSFFEECPPYDRWLTMPDTGHIIASCYNVVLIYLSMSLSATFLPTRTTSLPLLERRHIAIGSVNDNHFVQVFLFPGHPMPPVSDCWHQVYLPDAEGWQTAYTERIQRFREIVGSDVATREMA
ncbi:hypothetical protein GBA52_000889 [Prunus armeniaca]|nr:hypothetical protein GBA52_000889 [Prunus armeniaca]